MVTSCQIAWALNKGIKPEFKQYWDVELGVTYIPWSKIREAQLEELKEGGMLDVDTLSPEWGATRRSLDIPDELATHNGRSEPQQPDETQVLHAVPNVPALSQVNISYSHVHQLSNNSWFYSLKRHQDV